MFNKIGRLINAIFDVMEDCIIILRQLYNVFKLMLQKRRTKFDKVSGRNVLILANGPSLKDLDFDLLLSSVNDIACMNWFALDEDRFKEIKPNYYCLADFVFFEDTDLYIEKKEKLYTILENVDWEMTIICPCGLCLPLTNTNIKYVWVNNNVFYGKRLIKFAHFLYKRNLASCGMETVALCPLYYFLSIKAKKVYLAGIDMSEFKGYVINEKNEIYLETKHFYGTNKVRRDGIGQIEKGEFYKLFACYQRMFEEFYYMAQYASSQNVEVINLSVNSFIDVFNKDSGFLKER